jgi:hypothetical protein
MSDNGASGNDWRIAGGVMDDRAEWLDAQSHDVGYSDEEAALDDARADVAYEANRPQYTIENDRYRGICGGCGQPVSAFAGHPGGHEGSCLWRPPGPWHPSCRERDRAAGGTADTPPPEPQPDQGVIDF